MGAYPSYDIIKSTVNHLPDPYIFSGYYKMHGMSIIIRKNIFHESPVYNSCMGTNTAHKKYINKTHYYYKLPKKNEQAFIIIFV